MASAGLIVFLIDKNNCFKVVWLVSLLLFETEVAIVKLSIDLRDNWLLLLHDTISCCYSIQKESIQTQLDERY